MVEDVRRGEVYWCRLDPSEGSEIRKTRPAVVVQNDVGNRNARTTIVVPVTSAAPERAYPFIVTLPAPALPKQGFVNCAHIRAVDKRRLKPGPLAVLDEATMARIDDALRASLGLH